MQKNKNRASAMLAVVTIAMCFAGSVAYAADPPAKTYQIGPQSVSAALKAFAAQSDMQLIFTEADVGKAKTPGVTGTKAPREALQEILKGTGLEFEFTANNVVVVKKVSAAALATKSSDPPGDGAKDPRKEGKNDSSDQFRVAQVGQGQTPGPSTVEKQDDQVSKKKKAEELLQVVVVTGSRIPIKANDGPQDVKIYTRETIEQSGQTTVASFLNTLSVVSVSITDTGVQTFGDATTVQLHGLPIGTTLTLLNGRRVETSGITQGGGSFFDLNSIPLAAVDRIEVVSEGSSAIYGSDAIAGVVNIILRKGFDGLEAKIGYGGASGTDEANASVSWGQQWDKGSLSVIGSYQTRSELLGSERSITANGDFTRFGGIDTRTYGCNPGNVFSVDGSNLPGLNAPFAAVPTGFTGTPSIQEFAPTAGTLNKCTAGAFSSIIPEMHRSGVFITGNYDLTDSTEFFSEFMFSHMEEYPTGAPPSLFSQPGFIFNTVSASNPFNPFGETVGVSGLLTSLGQQVIEVDTNFRRALLGLKGRLLGDWQWEVAGWSSEDDSKNTQTNQLGFFNQPVQGALNSADSSTALNPFVDGPYGSLQLLQSLVHNQFAYYSGSTAAANAFVRGPIVELPSGPIELVVGGEFDHDKLYLDQVNSPFYPPNTTTRDHRDHGAAFGEMRIPIVANRADARAGDTLAVTLAGRFDHYNDFGNSTTPQFGIEWRPLNELLIRGTYSRAFRAPTLGELNFPRVAVPQGATVTDPLNGNQTDTITLTNGGNPNLRPETGRSEAFGFVYSGNAIPNLRVSVTQWELRENGQIQNLDTQTIVNNAAAFPGRVIRGPGTNGQPGPIIEVDDTYVNFGATRVAGLDYNLSYKYQTSVGELLPSIAATETYHYTAALLPGTAPTDRLSMANDDGDFAPRWKGTVALGLKLGPYVANLAGRYIGRYQDYDSTSEIGNFWYFDANFRCAIGTALASDRKLLKGAYLEFGGVNLLNKLPQYSNYQAGNVGYDPSEADIRGRFLYVHLGGQW